MVLLQPYCGVGMILPFSVVAQQQSPYLPGFNAGKPACLIQRKEDCAAQCIFVKEKPFPSKAQLSRLVSIRYLTAKLVWSIVSSENSILTFLACYIIEKFGLGQGCTNIPDMACGQPPFILQKVPSILPWLCFLHLWSVF